MLVGSDTGAAPVLVVLVPKRGIMLVQPAFIVCGNVLYALADPRRSVAVLKSQLSPGGRLVVTTPRAGVRHQEDHAAAHQSAGHRLPTGDRRAAAVRGLMGADVVRPTCSHQGWLAVCDRADGGGVQC
jgi:hypothetical protein